MYLSTDQRADHSASEVPSDQIADIVVRHQLARLFISETVLQLQCECTCTGIVHFHNRATVGRVPTHANRAARVLRAHPSLLVQTKYRARRKR